MIATATPSMTPRAPRVARTATDFTRLLDSFRGEAQKEATALFEGVSGKRIAAASVPGVSQHSVSRALNGCESNPLARFAGWVVLCRRLGVPKSKLQRLINWAQEVLDHVYEDAPPEPLEKLLDRDAELDGRDELPRQRAARGDKAAMVELLEIEREQAAHSRTVIAAVRAEVAVYL